MKLNELSEPAKQRAIADMQRRCSDLFDGDSTIYYWKDVLKTLGFIDITIMYSGFWSQGDGACFTGHWSPDWVEIDNIKEFLPTDDPEKFGTFAQDQFALNKLLRAADVYDADENGQTSFVVGSVKLHHKGRYYHEHQIDYEFHYESGVNDELEEEFKEWCRMLMRMIYRDLEADYDYQTSEEYAIEAIEANEYDYNEEGDMI